METYPCECCGESVEIELHEALIGNNEPYEFNLCPPCFDKEDE